MNSTFWQTNTSAEEPNSLFWQAQPQIDFSRDAIFLCFSKNGLRRSLSLDEEFVSHFFRKEDLERQEDTELVLLAFEDFWTSRRKRGNRNSRRMNEIDYTTIMSYQTFKRILKKFATKNSWEKYNTPPQKFIMTVSGNFFSMLNEKIRKDFCFSSDEQFSFYSTDSLSINS